MKKFRLLAVFLSFALLAFGCFTLSACSEDKQLVGVCMPKNDADRWSSDGSNIKTQLENKGYKVKLDYAEDDPDRQITQIQDMIKAGCKALIIAASDCYNLNEVLGEASAKGIKIIAYDRLIMDTVNVDYYCTFDNFEVGERQAKFIEEKFNLKTAAGPFYMEIFVGDEKDSTVEETFDAQMSVLRTYIESGKLIIASGQDTLAATAIADWSSVNAQTRMETLLSNYYTDKTVDVILSMNDSIALGVMPALETGGYELGNAAVKPWPVITGMDCDIANVKAIKNDKQTMSLFIDTRALSTKAVELADDILRGKEPTIDNASRYNNQSESGKPGKIVPAVICRSVSVDKSNYYSVLITSGFYKAEDLE